MFCLVGRAFDLVLPLTLGSDWLPLLEDDGEDNDAVVRVPAVDGEAVVVCAGEFVTLGVGLTGFARLRILLVEKLSKQNLLLTFPIRLI